MRKITPKKFNPLPPNAKRVFKGIIYDVYQWEQKLFDGSVATFEMLSRPDAVRVLAVRDDKIVILKQEQPDIGYFIDLPGGRHDIDREDELQAAQRELLEETGLIFKDWKLIQAEQLHFKIDQVMYLFLASNFEKQVEPHRDAGEKIEVAFMTLDEVKGLFNDPDTRYLPPVLKKAESIQELLDLPEVTG